MISAERHFTGGHGLAAAAMALGGTAPAVAAPGIPIVLSWPTEGASAVITLGLLVLLILLLVVLVRSRSARRRAENAWSESRARLEQALDQMPAVVWTTDQDLRFTSSEGAALSAIGPSAGEVVGQTIEEYCGSEDPEFPIIAAHRKAIEGAPCQWDQVWDGRTFHCDVRPLRNRSGRCIGCIGMAFDVTERIRVKDDLRQTQARLSTVLARLPSVVLYETGGGREFISSNIASLTGHDASDFESDRELFPGLIHKDDLARMVQRVRAWHAEDAPDELWLEFRLRHRDGSERWVEDRMSRGHGPPGNRTMTGVLLDVTERREADATLRETEDRFRQVMEHVQNVFYLHDPVSGKLLYVSPAYESIWGDVRDDLYKDPSSWRRRVHPKDRGILASMDTARASGGNYELEYRIIDARGKVRWIRDVGFPIFDEAGRLHRLAGSAEDVTARRDAAEALRRSEERFRQLAENVPGTIYMCPEGSPDEVRYLNDAVESLTGYAKDEFLTGVRSFRELCHEVDRPTVQRAIKEARRGRRPFHVVYRLRHSDGTWRWVEEYGTSVYDDRDHTVLFHEGFIHDISDRKAFEAELDRRNEVERLLFRELDHRVRNNLAALSALVDLGTAKATSVTDFATSIQGRIRAMSGVHEMLSRSRGTAVDFRRITAAMIPADLEDQVMLQGPAVGVPGRQATALAMVLHELVTNSLKHGALRQPGGRIEVVWAIPADPDGPSLRWSWRERGGPPVPTERSEGVGTDLLTGLVRSELRGSADLMFDDDGANHVFEIRFVDDDPVPRGSASRAAEATVGATPRGSS